MPSCCSSSKRSMVGSEMLRGKGMQSWKQRQKGQVCREVYNKKSQADILVCHWQAQGHQRVTKH